MRTGKIYFIFTLFVIVLYSCNDKQTTSSQQPVKKQLPVRVKPSVDIAYRFEKPKAWLKNNYDSLALRNVMAINRTDIEYLKTMDSILVPNDVKADIAFYFPFPLRLEEASGIDKLIFFSYPAQAFGAYENGELIYAGPTNMGRRKDQTPTGLFFTNWKAEKTTSSFDDEWELKWNFNIENKEGVGWHQYAMPGYPASHSCLRLTETDARLLYRWADQWVLEHEEVKYKGTPVIVFGKYDFDAAKPWLKLAVAPHTLDISENELGHVLAPYKNEIMAAQDKRKQGAGSIIKSK